MTFVADVLSAVSSALQPVRVAFTNEVTLRQFFAELGWDVAVAPGEVATVRAGFGLVDSLGAVEDIVERLDAGGEDAAGLAQALRTALGGLIDVIKGLSAAPPQGLPAPLDQAAFWSEFPPALGDRLLVRMLESEAPALYAVMRLLGMIERTQEAPTGAARLPYTRLAIRWDRLPSLVGDPVKVVQELYRWDDAGGQPFQADALLLTLEDALRALRLPARTEPITPALAERYYADGPAVGQIQSLVIPIVIVADADWASYVEAGLVIAPIPASGQSAPPPVGIVLAPHVVGEFTSGGDAGTGLTLSLRGGFDLDGAFGAEVRPTGVDLFAAPGAVSIDAALTVSAQPEAPWRLLGDPGSFRVEIGGFEVGLAVRGRLESPEVEVRAGTGHGENPPKIAVVIQMSDADGFLGTVLGTDPIRLELGGAVVWSSSTGLHLEGGGGFEFSVPLHLDLHIAVIEALTIALRGSGSGLTLDAGVAGKALLGPLTAVVEEFGLRTTLMFAGDDGKLGPVQVGIGFKPPKGVGLAVNAGVVKGGGYLYLDADRGEYAGALELVFSEFLTLKAIGIITTRMPDGSPGFSLLVIITAEFGTGIQLGFGFTLIGVGGLLGLNRTMLLQPLMDGVRTGAIQSIMFPRDVVANAPRIISDLRTIFPPRQGTFLIGPMAKLGWGTPPIISVALGVIFEIPGNIAIVGVIRVVLPADDAAVLVLQVNFAGVIEFDRQRLYFFASIFDSRVLFMSIEGEMGLLVAWGGDANFVLSVGGFHPRFSPPPLPFPSPRRVAIDILSTSVSRIRVEGYFAVTSNTAQFGAYAELRLGFDSIGIQGHIAFDALFRFSPFAFIIQISASVSLKAFGIGLFSVRLQFALEGPTPWRAHGSGSISLLFFEISADFDVTWGEARDTSEPPIDVLPLIANELTKVEGWEARLPAGAQLLVTSRKLDTAADRLVLHPVGMLRVHQRAVPLDLRLDKVGAQRPRDASKFAVEVTAGGLTKAGDVDELFALAQFQDMDDATKLSRRPFEPQHGGIDLIAGAALTSARMVKRTVRYEEIVIDTNFRRFTRRFASFVAVLFAHFLKGNAISRSPLSMQQRRLLRPFEETITVVSDQFAVAFTDTNRVAAEHAVFTSEASAHEFLAERVSADPRLDGALHVVPAVELNRSAVP